MIGAILAKNLKHYTSVYEGLTLKLALEHSSLDAALENENQQDKLKIKALEMTKLIHKIK